MMEARAMARFARVTPRKARRGVDLTRGPPADDADGVLALAAQARRVVARMRGRPADEVQAVLAFAPQSASDPVGKVLASAIANADARGGRGDRGILWGPRASGDE